MGLRFLRPVGDFVSKASIGVEPHLSLKSPPPSLTDAFNSIFAMEGAVAVWRQPPLSGLWRPMPCPSCAAHSATPTTGVVFPTVFAVCRQLPFQVVAMRGVEPRAVHYSQFLNPIMTHVIAVFRVRKTPSP